MITVNELVAMAEHELTMVSGHSGGDRVIAWAHVCELPDPWHWVRPGDLVLTIGAGLPGEPDAQRQWFSALADVGVCGLVLAPPPGAPPPSADLLTVADERSVPLITADFSLQFSALTHTVIESAVRAERDHVATARRLFDVYSEAFRSRADLAGRLDAVARSVGWSISVTSRSDGRVLAAGGEPEGGQLEDERATPITVPVPGTAAADIRVRPSRRDLLDGSLVHYLAGLVGIELEHLARAGRERRRQGAVVLRGALDGSVSGAQLRHELSARGMGDGPIVLAVLRQRPGEEPAEADLDLDRRPPGDVVPLLAAINDEWVALVPAAWAGLDQFRRALAPAACAGLSLPLAPGAALGDAHLQARAAAGRAVATGRTVLDYAALDDGAGHGAHSLTDMRSLVDRVLGPIIEHDRAAGTELVRSLDLFLANDRSWTRTAETLGVHRQTLTYRITQVERLSGLKPTSTVGITTFWAALDAARELGIVQN